MLIHICLLILVIKSSLSTTSIKTYPTVNLTENVPINTNVIKLINEENVEMRKLKLILLNLGGFETNYFEIKNENILTKNLIDREQFVGEKRCFDRFYCLIELHILVNDGQQYWVIPIHIIE
jgi:predicted NUDIX family phosphoesterase